MAFLDIIEFFDESGEEMAHRIPQNGSGETKFGSQLVVRESQTAVFFRDGNCYDEMGPGRHTLSTQNIPFLTKALTKIAGFGEKSPFRIEVVFVNRKVFTDMKWGTKEPVAFRDSELGIVRLRAFGNYTMKIIEPSLFVNTMVGTRGMYSTDDAETYLKGAITSRLNDLLGEQLDTILNLPALYDEIGVALKMRVAEDFKKYGLEIIDFFVNSITPPEEVQKMFDERAGMGAVGDMNKFMQFQAAKSMRDAVQPGSGGGGIAAAGMGVGVGAGLGMMMPGMIAQSMQPGQQPAPSGGGGAAGAGAAAMIACAACGQPASATSKFCPNCGGKIESASCPSCQKPVAPGAKFCPECGTKIGGAPKCPGCQAELQPGAKFCPGCGTKIG